MKLKKLKGILIDAYNKKIETIDLSYTDTSDLINKMYVIGKYSTFAGIRVSQHDMMFVDDEGLINGTKVGFISNLYTDENNKPIPLMGNAIIIGTTRSGGNKNCTLKIKDLEPEIKFFKHNDEIISKS